MSETVMLSFVSVVVSAIVSWLVTYFSFRKKDRSELDVELSNILKIGIEHPCFELDTFTQSWDPAQALVNEKYAAYDLYATLVFNFLEKYCKYYDFDEKKFLSKLDVRDWILVHKKYWKNPINAFENKDAYDERFVEIVKKVID